MPRPPPRVIFLRKKKANHDFYNNRFSFSMEQNSDLTGFSRGLALCRKFHHEDVTFLLPFRGEPVTLLYKSPAQAGGGLGGEGQPNQKLLTFFFNY